MRRSIYPFVFLLLFIIVSCKKSALPGHIDIKGFQLVDVFGNPIGHVGPADQDWQLMEWSSLSAFEQSLLSGPDTVNTNNTNLSTVSIVAYPNPVRDIGAVTVGTADSVKFKLVITDKTGTVLRQFSQKVKGYVTFQIDLSDRNIFPFKKELRYYFSFSAASVPNFKVGYGDVKICDYYGGGNVISTCF